MEPLNNSNMGASSSRVIAEISLAAIVKNFQTIQKRVGDRDVMVVLKANAYGLGATQIAKALELAGAARIGVAELKEALSIRSISNLPIQIIGGLLDYEIAPAIQAEIILPIGDLETALKISESGKMLGKIAKVHFILDTGMGRLGFPATYDDKSSFEFQQLIKTIEKIAKLPNLNIEGIYTHFSSANEPQNPYTLLQLQRFKNVLSMFPENWFSHIHAANSDAINNFPETLFNMVRTGINLYGVFDLEGRHAYELVPAVKVKTSLIAIRQLKAGSKIGYGCQYILPHDTYVGTICAGYADGIPLAASNKGNVLIEGNIYPVIGRVSMDYTTVDLGRECSLTPGAEVILVGSSGKHEITIEDYAIIKKTHPYEIICSLGSRVERTYRN